MIAFVRRHGGKHLLVAAPRLPFALLQGSDGLALAPHVLKETVVQFEEGLTLDRHLTGLPFLLLTSQP
jgi:hypothetical protein